jgi:hypothetical protein
LLNLLGRSNLNLRNLLVEDNIVVLQENVTQDSKVETITKTGVASTAILLENERINGDFESATTNSEN